MDRLPMELIILALGFLPHGDLRAAAVVSRHFYRASQEAGCSMLLRVHLGAPGGHEDAIATFDAVVAHALAKPAADRPGLALRLVVYRTPADLDAPFARIMQTVEKAIPLFVALDAYVPAQFTDALHRVLCASAAPRLRSLVLCQVNDGRSPAIAPLVDLFARTAPRLCTLSLAVPRIDVKWPSVAVFARVVTAHLILYRPAQHIVVSKLLPHVQSLIVTLERDKRSDVLFSPDVNLDGLSLSYLAIDGDGNDFMSCDISGIDVDEIPVFEGALGGRFADGFWTHVPSSDAPITMRLGRSVDAFGMNVPAISLTGASWKRVAYSASAVRSPALERMPGLALRLTVVMMECMYLDEFLGTDALLPVLDELCIEVSQGLHDLTKRKASAALLRCPALGSVTLFVHSARPFEIRVERVALLGGLLRQEERPSVDRAILRLVQVGFLRPQPMAHRKRLKFVFPSVERASQLSPEMLRLADSCASEIRASLVPFYPLVRPR